MKGFPEPIQGEKYWCDSLGTWVVYSGKTQVIVGREHYHCVYRIEKLPSSLLEVWLERKEFL